MVTSHVHVCSSVAAYWHFAIRNVNAYGLPVCGQEGKPTNQVVQFGSAQPQNVFTADLQTHLFA